MFRKGRIEGLKNGRGYINNYYNQSIHRFLWYVGKKDGNRSKERDRVLSQLVFEAQPKSIMEIGVFVGGGAEVMVKAASKSGIEGIKYYGIDLFFRKGVSATRSRIKTAGAKEVFLYEGDSKKILPELELPKMDFVYIDGGNDYNTVKSDWQNTKKLLLDDSVVVFDYRPRVLGIKNVIEEIKNEEKFSVETIPMNDPPNYAVVRSISSST